MALYAGLKRLRQDASKAATCLDKLPATSPPGLEPGEQLQPFVYKLCLAALAAQDALDEHDALVFSTPAAAGTQQASHNQARTEQQRSDLSRQSSTQVNLYNALDQLQRAAGPVMSSARAATRASCNAAAVDMQHVFDILMSMAESVYHAQNLLRQYADAVTPAAAAAVGKDNHKGPTDNTAAAGESAGTSLVPQQQPPRHQETMTATGMYRSNSHTCVPSVVLRCLCCKLCCRSNAFSSNASPFLQLCGHLCATFVDLSTDALCCAAAGVLHCKQVMQQLTQQQEE